MTPQSRKIRRDERLPFASGLRDWLSDAYQQQSGIDGILSLIPFEHFVLPDLLKPDVFPILVEACFEECRRMPMTKDQDERGLLYAPLLLRPAIDFFCGSTFRLFLGSIVGGHIVRPADSVPQLRRLVGPVPPMRPHTDAGASFSFATFFFVHRSWRPDQGGETILLDPGLREVRRIPPRPNTLYGMFFSSRSLHAVSQLADKAGRIFIYQEWN